MRSRVWGLRFGVWGSGLGATSFGFRVSDSEFRVTGSGVPGPGFRVSGFMYRVSPARRRERGYLSVSWHAVCVFKIRDSNMARLRESRPDSSLGFQDLVQICQLEDENEPGLSKLEGQNRFMKQR